MLGDVDTCVCVCEQLAQGCYLEAQRPGMGIGDLSSRDSDALTIGNESVPIQLTQCRFPGLAISNAKI